MRLMQPVAFLLERSARTRIYTLSLHDALPIFPGERTPDQVRHGTSDLALLEGESGTHRGIDEADLDRKSTRLNSSHRTISYAVFCLKKKKPRSAAHRSARHPVQQERNANIMNQ